MLKTKKNLYSKV